ncbi:C40 family peptidase [Mucilaginibacter paludis]|uniref:NLP/P60 protein n=1 Tax=Mucilaginibacter paludis DSM 18603 TaxID=714943 RepID=H1Y7K0_9SPHI|nr:C40 family peptidase [Mucilaginibacter paludis]EHQ29421.1 NLP/P60 protein [Mucilaginibacter paludis DSM 18603]
MEYGICNLAIAPLRAEATHRSEMTSQLLFGETFEIVERTDDWSRIVTTFDGYEGWITNLQYQPVTAGEILSLSLENIVTTRSVVTPVLKESDNSVLSLPFGCSLPFYDGADCRLAGINYNVRSADDLTAFLETAYSFLNTPYLWGGRTHFGIDCSGYTQAVLRTRGTTLQRDAYLQAGQGTAVDFLLEARLGDLAFFDNAEGRITHVGIMLDNHSIIHASGRVKIDQIDDQGIYSAEQKKYTHKLRIVKRYLTADFDH